MRTGLRLRRADVIKTRAKGWAALIVSGYNNVGGKGFLYVVTRRPATHQEDLAAG
jgi:hypothetical protein